jgi:hypothetical protein
MLLSSHLLLLTPLMELLPVSGVLAVCGLPDNVSVLLLLAFLWLLTSILQLVLFTVITSFVGICD